MAKKTFQELMDETMSPEDQAAARAQAREYQLEMALGELRKARMSTQQELAQKLDRNQGSISELERRTDAYVSTLRRYIEALGGELDIVARFPEGDVRITQFAEAG